MYTFLHFVVSLQSILYTLGLIFVFDVTIYSYNLRLFKIDPVVSVQPARQQPIDVTIFHFSVVFAVTSLASRYFCFKHLDRVKRVIFQASDIDKRLRINVLVIL